MNYPPEIQEFLEKSARLILDERGIIKLQSAEFYCHIVFDSNIDRHTYNRFKSQSVEFLYSLKVFATEPRFLSYGSLD